MIIVRKNTDGEWVRWTGFQAVKEKSDKADAVYADGRREEIKVKPYEIDATYSDQQLTHLLESGTWDAKRFAETGAKIVVPFELPEGRQVVGEAKYAEDKDVVYEVYDTEEIPPPPAPPTVEEKVADMLAAFGLSVPEFQSVINPTPQDKRT